MSRLGKHQLARLAGMAHVGMAQIVPDAVSSSLVARGLMDPTKDTIEGFRAIADAIDAGQISNKPDWEKEQRGR